MRSPLWFYCSCILLLALLLKQFYFVENNMPINAFEITNTDTLDFDVIKYPESESIPIEYLHPIVIYNNNILNKGDIFKSRIALAAYVKSPHVVPYLIVNGQKVEMNKNGVGHYWERADRLGVKTLKIMGPIKGGGISGKKIMGGTTFEYYVKTQEKTYQGYEGLIELKKETEIRLENINKKIKYRKTLK